MKEESNTHSGADLSGKHIPGLSQFDFAIEKLAIFIGGVLLTFITLLIVVNVLVMRKFLNAPIQGAEDTLILALIALVALSIPFGGRIGSHIEIEVVTELMGQRATRICLIITRFIGAVFIACMSWQLGIAGAKAERFGEVTQQLEISYEYFYYGLAVCFALFSVAQLFDIVQLIRRGKIKLISENKDNPE